MVQENKILQTFLNLLPFNSSYERDVCYPKVTVLEPKGHTLHGSSKRPKTGTGPGRHRPIILPRGLSNVRTKE